MKLNPKARLVASNLFWAAAGKVVTLLGSLFVGIVIARYLGPEQYGLMSYVVSFVALFQIVASFGLDNIEIREESKPQNDVGAILGTAMTLRGILAVLVVVATIATSAMMEADKTITAYVAIYSLSVIGQCFILYRNYFTAIVENEYIAKSQILATLIGVTLKVILLLNNATLACFIFVTALDYFFQAIGYIISYKKRAKERPKWHFDRKLAVYLLKESFPLLLTSAAVLVYQRIDQVMIGRLIDKESVGYFSVASRMVDVIIYLPQIAVQTVMPLLIRIREQDERQYRERAQTFMGLTVWGTGLFSLAVSLIAQPAITLLFGDAYANAIPILQILSFKAMALALSIVAGQMLIIEGLQRWAIFRDSLGCVVCITLNYLFLPRYGAVFAAVSAILSNLTAGYLADAIIPPYRHLFVVQTKALLTGWTDIFKIKKIISK